MIISESFYFSSILPQILSTDETSQICQHGKRGSVIRYLLFDKESTNNGMKQKRYFLLFTEKLQTFFTVMTSNKQTTFLKCNTVGWPDMEVVFFVSLLLYNNIGALQIAWDQNLNEYIITYHRFYLYWGKLSANF